MTTRKSKSKTAADVQDFARFQCIGCANGKPEQSGYKPSAEGVGMVSGLLHRVKKNLGLGRLRDGFVVCRASEMWRAMSTEFKA